MLEIVRSTEIQTKGQKLFICCQGKASKRESTPGVPRFTALRYCASFTEVAFFTDWRQDPPPAQRLRLTLLQYSLHCGGLELNRVCLWCGFCLEDREVIARVLLQTSWSLFASAGGVGSAVHSHWCQQEGKNRTGSLRLNRMTQTSFLQY